ncbi:MAG: hypothetical protein WCY11_12235 [Novosphingobium sp.]
MDFISSFSTLAASSLALVLAACSGTPKEPAELVIIGDLSASTPLSTDKGFAEKAARAVTGMIGEYGLGDTVVLMSAGESGIEGTRRQSFRLTPQLNHKAVIAKVGATIAYSPDSPLSGQQNTALTYAIEESGLHCHGRDRLVLISDGMESRRGFDRMDEVIADTVDLPSPPAGILTGCKVSVLGIGVAAAGQSQLNNEELRNLKAAWRKYFRSAGVADADIELTSIF